MSQVRFDRPIAHRGLHNRAAGVIENSPAAFAAAIAAGWAIECDLQLSSDGEAIVFHDAMLERLTAETGPVAARSASELTALPLLDSADGECPMRFGELLGLVNGRVLLQVELKPQRNRACNDALARAAVAALAYYGGPLVIESFHPGLLVAARRHGFRGALGIVTYRYRTPEWDGSLTAGQRFVVRHLLHWPWTRFGFISCYVNDLDLPAVRLCRALGMPVTAWTVRTPEERVRALAGADQIVFEGFMPHSA